MEINPRLVETLGNANTIFFVCSGNIIRSSFAHLYAEYLEIPREIKSLGTQYHNRYIHPKSADELKKLGITDHIINDFKPTHISEIDAFPDQAIFFAMTQEHKQDLMNFGINSDQIHLLSELLGKEDDIADPYFNGNYDEAYQTIRDSVDQLSVLYQ